MSSIPCLLDLGPLWTPVRRLPWVPSWSQYTTLRRKSLASSSGPCLSPASLPSTHTPGSGLPRKCTSPLEASSHFLQRLLFRSSMAAFGDRKSALPLAFQGQCSVCHQAAKLSMCTVLRGELGFTPRDSGLRIPGKGMGNLIFSCKMVCEREMV